MTTSSTPSRCRRPRTRRGRAIRRLSLVALGLLHAGPAAAQSITTAPVQLPNAHEVPLDDPAALALLALGLAALGSWVLLKRRGSHGAPFLWSGILLLAVWSTPSLRAQVLSQFTNPAGETLPIPIQAIEARGVLQGFERADFHNATGAHLRIVDIEEPDFAACFPDGLTVALAPPEPLTEGLCEIDAVLPPATECHVDVDAFCKQLAALHPVTTLSPSVELLALSVNDAGADPVLPGTPRIITVSNLGPVAAHGLQTSSSGLPAGTSITTNTCSGTLGPGASCAITITPGTTASPDAGGSACTTAPGAEPVPTTLAVASDNAPSISVDVLVLGYGCIHQGGFVFAVDDTTPHTGSIGGKVAALADEASAGWATASAVTGAASLIDGHANSALLATPEGHFPAAQACLNRSDLGFDDWYLPAVCELGRYVGLGTDAGCGTSNPNLYTTLHANGLGGLSDSPYWSSTEFSGYPEMLAWLQSFENGLLLTTEKVWYIPARCVRAFAP